MNTLGPAPLTHYRDQIVAHVRSCLPLVVTVEAHHGRLDEAEISRLCVQAPFVAVCVLGVDGLEQRGGKNAVTSMGLFIVTSVGREGQDPGDAALALAGAVLSAIEGQRFQCDVSAPSSVRAENYTSGAMQAQNTALWAVTWKAGVDVTNAIATPELDDFLRAFVREKADGPVTQEIHVPGPEPEGERA